MRAAPWLLLLLVAPAQGAFLEDPEGDVELDIQGTATAPPDGWFEAVDLLALDIEEDLENLIFHLDVASLEHDDDAPIVESMEALVTFSRGEIGYLLRMPWNLHLMTATGEEPSSLGRLEEMDASGQFPTRIRSVEVAADVEAGRLSATIPRIWLLDESAAMPLPGHTLDDLEIRSRAENVELPFELINAFTAMAGQGAVPVAVQDHMPAGDAATYVVQEGGGVVQGLSLSSQAPARMSNGEATTLLFEPQVLSLLDEATELRFTSEGAPSGWEVWFPAQASTLEAGATAHVPVLVAIPFAHQHGEREEFIVRVEAADDPATYGTLTLAVQYTEVPQPAGHHDRVWIHGRDSAFVRFFDVSVLPSVRGFWNTVEDDGNGQPIHAQHDQFDEVGSVAHWTTPLIPGLGMGLQVDTTRTTSAAFDIETDRAMQQVLLGGRIFHEANGNVTTLATLEPLEGPRDLTMAGATFEADVVPTGVERIPYDPDGSLWFQVWLQEEGDELLGTGYLADNYANTIRMTQGWMDLPLLEYHDAVDSAYASVQQVRLSAQQERLVNPGESVIFDVTLFNNGPADATYALQLTGPSAEHATLGEERIDVPRGGQTTIPIGVSAPGEASRGDVLDVFVEAQRADDADIRALLRLVARVETTEDLPDEAADLPVAPEDEDSPGPAMLWLVLALIAVVWRRK